MSGVPLPVPSSLGRLERGALSASLLGVLGLLAGYFADPAQFYRSYLFGYLFWTGVALGCLSILLISHLTGGLWGLVTRRLLEAGTRTLPALAVLFVPVALGVSTLYPWTHPGDDEILAHKAAYLNVPFFLGRAAFYFALWILIATLLNRWSLALDERESLRVARRLRGASGVGLVLLGLTITFAAVDWAMSLAPHWFSTIYGIAFMVGQALSALALVIVIAVFLADERPMSDVLRPGTLQDLGKLLLAFTMLWAYVHLSQFLIVWSGNLAEETPYYLRRLQGGWQHLGLFLVVFHFALPFLLLLSRDVKRNPRVLGGLAAWVMAVRVADLYWTIGPDLGGHGHAAVPLSFHWLDVAAPLGLGGLWLFLFARELRGRPLLPLGEPELRELLEAEASPAETHR
jgi:hypothetical protein